MPPHNAWEGCALLPLRSCAMPRKAAAPNRSKQHDSRAGACSGFDAFQLCQALQDDLGAHAPHAQGRPGSSSREAAPGVAARRARTFLLVSWISPPMMNSSRIRYTCRPRVRAQARTIPQRRQSAPSAPSAHVNSAPSKQRSRPAAAAGQAARLVEVEHQVQLAHVAEVVIQDLHKQVDALQVGQLVVGHVHAEAKVQPRIAAVDHLVGLELRTARLRSRHSRQHLYVSFCAAQRAAAAFGCAPQQSW